MNTNNGNNGKDLLDEYERLKKEQAKQEQSKEARTGPTGPRTEAGKNRSRLNAFRHGLTGQVLVLTEPDRIALDKHIDGMMEAYSPVGYLETSLVQAIAENLWRLRRARAIENCVFALGNQSSKAPDTDHEQLGSALAQAVVWVQEGKNLNLLTLYEQRIQRSIEKNTAELKAMQAERKAGAQRTLEETLKLAKLAWMRRQEFDPAALTPIALPATATHEFVFSAVQLAKIVEREVRLNEAEYYAKRDWESGYEYQKPPITMPQAA